MSLIKSIPSGMLFLWEGKVAPISTTKDMRIIARQLGRRPRPGTDVCRRCRYGFPQVVISPPVVRDGCRWDIFPTVYWLTCPHLIAAIGRLEAQGWIGRYEKRLAEEPHFAEALAASHAAAAADRLRRVPAEWRDALERDYPRLWQSLAETGVAGIRSRSGVKCLHAHYADYVGRGDNPIGRAVEA
ncbi:MAG: hypothetical protein BAA04_08775, partial [Firmicutes bacterium ZCTH02-B6]